MYNMSHWYYLPKSTNETFEEDIYVTLNKEELLSVTHSPYGRHPQLTTDKTGSKFNETVFDQPELLFECLFESSTEVAMPCKALQDPQKRYRHAFFSPKYGVCWTLDFNGTTTKAIGAYKGLRLTLNTQGNSKHKDDLPLSQ